ncbi:MAG TPA: DUF1573 domain-containing protein [Bacteroidia bacterium]|nr:DUF1573 domain-containing protein [Bacteroidia bacterium]
MERLNRFLLLTTALLFSAISAFSQGVLNTGDGDDPADPTVIEFEKSEYHLGTFKAGDPVKAVFKFKNAGDADLIIDTVKPSCSCTALDWTTTPIKPGASGEIKAEIDTADREGDQEKSFAVVYNGNPPVERVILKFTVLPADGAAPQGDADGDGIK